MDRLNRQIKQLKSFPLMVNLNKIAVKIFPTVKNLNVKDKLIKKQLYRDLYPILDNLSTRKEYFHNERIVWVMWQQGFDMAPALVKMCRKSLDKFLPKDVSIIELDDNNVNQYINIPIVIQKKYEEGIISRAHYSDIVRCLILKEYGGIWMDSTILLTEKFDSEIFMKKFWTIKQKNPIVSNFSWAMYALGGTSNLIYGSLSDLLIQYWKLYDVEIDYLFLDYLMDLMRESDARIEKMISEVPTGNEDVLTLTEAIHDNADPKVIDSLLNGSTKIFKMTYRLNEHMESYKYFAKKINSILN